jgi:hypothetical protein
MHRPRHLVSAAPSCSGTLHVSYFIHGFILPKTTHAAWKEFFEVLLNFRRDIPEGVYEDLTVCSNTDPTVEMPPTRKEVSWGLQAVLNYKSAGVCGVKGEMLKKGGSNLVTLVHQLINAIWETGHMPDQWREGIIAPM